MSTRMALRVYFPRLGKASTPSAVASHFKDGKGIRLSQSLDQGHHSCQGRAEGRCRKLAAGRGPAIKADENGNFTATIDDRCQLNLKGRARDR